MQEKSTDTSAPRVFECQADSRADAKPNRGDFGFAILDFGLKFPIQNRQSKIQNAPG
jgi:hypothetical protein